MKGIDIQKRREGQRERDREIIMEETHHNNNNTGPPLLRLAGLKTAQLPAPSATAEELRPFITALLREAVPFIDTVAPKAAGPAPANTLWKSKGVKTLPESDARVEVTERVVEMTKAGAGSGEGGGGGGEEKDTWVCRRSVHADSAVRGSASWAEFVDCLRDRHAETEEAFTPGVVGHRVAVTWAVDGETASSASSSSPSSQPAGRLGPVEAGGTAWGRFGLFLVEMKHKIPAPLRPRVFPVVQLIASAVPPGGGGGGDGTMTAEGHGLDEFVVVSVTVDDFAGGGLGDRAVLSADRGVVTGAYASVERVRRLPGGARGGIEWIMATASDAKGVLPMWVQTRAVPGQIAKDVGMFLGWIVGERAKEKGKGKGGNSASASAQA